MPPIVGLVVVGGEPLDDIVGKPAANCANVNGSLVRLSFRSATGSKFVLIELGEENGEIFSSAGDVDVEGLLEMLVPVSESRDDTDELFCRLLRNTCCKGIRVRDIDISFHPHRYIS